MESIRKMNRVHVLIGVIVTLGLIDTVSKLLVMARVDLYVPATWSNLALAVVVGVVFFA